MKLIIQGKQLQLSENLKAHVEEHVYRPLLRFYDNQAAELRVELGKAHAHGEAREVHLTLHMPGTSAIQIEEEQDDLFAAINLAADRLERACKKELERMRQPSGHRAEHPLAALVDEAEGG